MRLTLKSITCRKTTAEITDEPYLFIFPDDSGKWFGTWGYWGPVSMRDGDTANIDRSYDFEEQVRVELWECDSAGGIIFSNWNDPLGSFVVSARHERGAFEEFLPFAIGSPNATRYSISFEVTRDESDRLDQWNLELVSLRCSDAQESEDEVYITVDDRRVWGPHKIRTGQTLTIGRGSIRIASPARIELWEEDVYSSDLIGMLSLDPAGGFDFGSLQQQTFSRDRGFPGSATYTLSYRVRET